MRIGAKRPVAVRFRNVNGRHEKIKGLQPGHRRPAERNGIEKGYTLKRNADGHGKKERSGEGGERYSDVDNGRDGGTGNMAKFGNEKMSEDRERKRKARGEAEERIQCQNEGRPG